MTEVIELTEKDFEDFIDKIIKSGKPVKIGLIGNPSGNTIIRMDED